MSDQTYKGSCHCGAVQYEVTMPPPEKAFACNCSICSRTGSLMAFVQEGAFKRLGRKDATTDYQFGKKNIHHEFCSTCGVRSYAHGRGKDGAPMYMINMRCLAGIDPTKRPVETFDGASL